MGEVALNTICGEDDRIRYNTIPWAVYSLPECAGCGLTEDQAKEQGYNVKTASLPMSFSGRFLAENGKKAPGSVKVVADADTDILLGVHMMGAGCSEMIYGVAVMLETIRISELSAMTLITADICRIVTAVAPLTDKPRHLLLMALNTGCRFVRQRDRH